MLRPTTSQAGITTAGRVFNVPMRPYGKSTRGFERVVVGKTGGTATELTKLIVSSDPTLETDQTNIVHSMRVAEWSNEPLPFDRKIELDLRSDNDGNIYVFVKPNGTLDADVVIFDVGRD